MCDFCGARAAAQPAARRRTASPRPSRAAPAARRQSGASPVLGRLGVEAGAALAVLPPPVLPLVVPPEIDGVAVPPDDVPPDEDEPPDEEEPPDTVTVAFMFGWMVQM